MYLETIIFSKLSKIPLDIEGSNISKTGWYPSRSEKKYMGSDRFNEALAEAHKTDSKVLFKNVFLSWDSCDCGDGHGCAHPSWVYEIRVMVSPGKFHTIDVEEDAIEFKDPTDIYFRLPISKSQNLTVFDFYRSCQLAGIDLEFSDYALSILNSSDFPKMYIAGKIGNLLPEDYEPLFEQGEEMARSLGYFPVSPLNLPHNHVRSWKAYMSEDLLALKNCDAIFMLDNWEDSRGARIEHWFAKRYGKKVFYQLVSEESTTNSYNEKSVNHV